MASLLRPLLRIASLQGRPVLEALVTGQFDALKTGKVMISATATSKAFSFTIPPGLDPASLMSAADEALSWFDSHTTEQMTAFLTYRPSNKVYIRY